MPISVAAVVVTYNRKQLLIECLDALLGQTRPLNKIILVDNASTDDTQDALQSRGYVSNPIVEYIRLPENTGGAGGFCEGLRQGHAAGYDWLWVMDDDAEPRKDALEQIYHLLSVQGIVGVACLQIGMDGNPQYDHRGWVQLCQDATKVLRPITDADLSRPATAIDHASFVGIAISREAIDEIGLPMHQFFIHYDDFEYCLRLRKVGQIILVPGSVILHKSKSHADQSATQIIKRRFLRESARTPLDKLWIRYYGIRNLTWLRRRMCPAHKVIIFMLKNYARWFLGVLIYDDHKFRRWLFFFYAFYDGWRGVFNNERPRKLLGLRW